MGFGVPIVLGMLLLAFTLLALRYGVRGRCEVDAQPPAALTRRALLVLGLFSGAVAAWLTEPLHGVGASTVALGLMLLLFATNLLGSPISARSTGPRSG